MENNFALLLTGMSGSGKSTIGNALVGELKNNVKWGGAKVQLIDGDETRLMLGGMFNHTREGRTKIGIVNRVIGHYLLENGISVIYALVTPFEDVREEFRRFFGDNFVEVYVKASLEECEKRDVKGLYKKYMNGEITNLNGKDDKYEPPQNADLVVDTVSESIDESCSKILSLLIEKGYIKSHI